MLLKQGPDQIQGPGHDFDMGHKLLLREQLSKDNSRKLHRASFRDI